MKAAITLIWLGQPQSQGSHRWGTHLIQLQAACQWGLMTSERPGNSCTAQVALTVKA